MVHENIKNSNMTIVYLRKMKLAKFFLNLCWKVTRWNFESWLALDALGLVGGILMDWKDQVEAKSIVKGLVGP